MVALKRILDAFSQATGLVINFHKSTFVPMHVGDDTAAEMASVLGCSISTFPQTYLGLPLSPHKLKCTDYQPLITSFDRYLAGWKARLLSTGGRLVLVNSVLGSLPIYYMSSILLPKTVREILDAKRRAFLWTGEEKCHGSSCLVAWEDVCKTKEQGGLGVKNLENMNHCLLLKFVHRMHDTSTPPWKQWLHSHGGEDSYLGKILSSELQRYQSLTIARIGTGEHVAFWHDRWLLNITLQEAFPALYTHCTRPAASVHHVLRDGLRRHLRPRLTNVAVGEESTLLDCLRHTTLTDRQDTRLLLSSPLNPSARGGRTASCTRGFPRTL